jgi:hypothetical protein
MVTFHSSTSLPPGYGKQWNSIHAHIDHTSEKEENNGDIYAYSTGVFHQILT